MSEEGAIRRRRGRPPLEDGDPSTDVCVKMPARLYDETYHLAAVRRVSVPELIRRALRLAIASDSAI